MQTTLPPWKSLARGDGFRARLVRGFAWTSVGFVGAQVMRLASNLLMTRLLAPEHFGVMAIVTVVLIGLAMFTDIGLGPGVVRSPKIDQPNFLNTAWTMQLARGALLEVVCMLVAYPASVFYQQPQLASLLPVAGLSIIISSLAPMQIYTRQRAMSIGKLVAIDLAAQAIALIAMIVAGIIFHSIWILVLGSLVASATRTIAQWTLLPGHRHRLTIVRTDAHDLIRFGGWIFVSSLLAFAANSAGSLVLGKLATMKLVGLFAIASTLAKAAEQFYEQLTIRVLFPMYASLLTDHEVDVRRRIFKIRVGIVVAFVPAMCLAAYFADPLFALLFDHRYQQAAWIFQVILMGMVPSVICSTLPYLVAQGSSVLGAWVSAVRLVGYLTLIAVGYHLHGEQGVIVGIACLPILIYLLDYMIQRRHGLSDFRIDIAALAFWIMTGCLIWQPWSILHWN